MKTASIANAKNQLSRLINYVKRGGSVIITDRNHPVARLEAVSKVGAGLDRLIGNGVLNPPVRGPLDMEDFLSGNRVCLDVIHSLSDAVWRNREEAK